MFLIQVPISLIRLVWILIAYNYKKLLYVYLQVIYFESWGILTWTGKLLITAVTLIK